MKLTIELFRYGTLFTFMGVAAVIDLMTGKIKNELNLTGFIFGVIFAILDPTISIWMALLGAVVAFVLSYFCWRIRAFKAGDAKLLCVEGVFVGPVQFLNCFLELFLIGGIFGIIFLIIKYKTGKPNKFCFALPIAISCVTGMFGYIWDIFFQL